MNVDRFMFVLLGALVGGGGASAQSLTDFEKGQGTKHPIPEAQVNAFAADIWMAKGSAPQEYFFDDAVPFDYRSIDATGIPLNLTDDGEANITLPFAFEFYGVVSSSLRVGNNGGILFNATSGDVGFSNTALPNAGHPFTIFPYWDDLDDQTGNVLWEVQGVSPHRVAIVEWFKRPHFPGPGLGDVTFQALLFEGSNRIKFQYLDLDFGDPALNFGASATVGLNRDDTTALQYSFNTPTLTNGMAILFTPLQFIEYSDRTEFDLEMPGLLCENFSGSTASAGSIPGIPAPLNSSTDNSVFPAGAIRHGIDFRDDPLNELGGGNSNGLAVVMPPAAGASQIAVVANTFTDAFVITFRPPVVAVGMDLHSFSSESSVEIQLFDVAENFLGTINRSGTPGGSFWGFTSTTPVARIRMDSLIDQAEGVGNICFGAEILIFYDGFEAL